MTQPMEMDNQGAAASQPPAPPAPPPAPPAQVPQTSAALTPISAAELKGESDKTAQDLANGHIRPETYADLFAKKDTLGKIGTLFGLMVSGAGSGLTGQPNAVMEMMKQQISNDVDAQKHSATNVQNLLKLNQENEANKATIGYTGAQAELAKAEAKSKAFTLTQMQANQMALHKLVTLANSYPVGTPERQAAEQQLALLSTQVQAENYNIADRAAIASALAHATFGKQSEAAPSGSNNEGRQSDTTSAVDIDKMNKLINLGRINPALPGAIPPGEVGPITQAAEQLNDNRVIAKAYDDSFKKLNSLGAGKFTPNLRSAMIASLAAVIARDTAGRYNTQEAMDQMSGVFPDVTDLPDVRKQKYLKFMDQLRGKEASSIGLTRYGLKTPFPSYSFGKKSGKDGGDVSKKDGKTQYKIVGGVTYKRGPNGEAIPVPQVAEK